MKKMMDRLKEFLDNEKFILLLFAFYVVTTNIDGSALMYYQGCIIFAKVIRYIIYFSATVKIIMKIINERKINLIITIMFILFTIIMFVSKDKSLITILLMILLVKDLNFEKLVKCCFYSNLGMYLILISGSSFGIIQNWTYTRGEIIRYSYGYCYPSLTSTYLFLLFLMRFYLKRGNVEVWEIALQLLTAVFIYQATDSRMGLALSLIIITAEVIIKIYNSLKISYTIIKIKRFYKILFNCISYISSSYNKYASL